MAVYQVINHIKIVKLTNISKLPAFFLAVSDEKSVRGFTEKCNKAATD
jgi:hypothetical protein